ncbi:hypothetical protein BJ165DRAFT_1418128 [Panaeolus papilionaceus]|nr:hypothetical protein BJ165DRAFT_1418128 [Panaeolus papilionaceus]
MGGDLPTYVDLSIAGRLWWYRSSLWLESQAWQNIASWHLGRWGRLITYNRTQFDCNRAIPGFSIHPTCDTVAPKLRTIRVLSFS